MRAPFALEFAVDITNARAAAEGPPLPGRVSEAVGSSAATILIRQDRVLSAELADFSRYTYLAFDRTIAIALGVGRDDLDADGAL